MVRHIVLFQFRTDVDEATREIVRNTFKKSIMSLLHKLDFIHNLEVGFNINKAEEWDICLSGTFDTLDDVKTYSQFPDHRAAADKLKEYLSSRSCVDYEIQY